VEVAELQPHGFFAYDTDSSKKVTLSRYWDGNNWQPDCIDSWWPTKEAVIESLTKALIPFVDKGVIKRNSE